MTKWICGVLVLALGAGAAAYRYSSSTPPEPPMTLPSSPYLRQKPLPPQAIETRTPTAPSPAYPVEIVHEPIVTVPELVEATDTVASNLPTTGGVEESEASATRLPRPDKESLYMPYADDNEFTALLFQAREFHTGGRVDLLPMTIPHATESLTWSGVLRWAFGLQPRDLSGAEESEEPPLLDHALPAQNHPPHCPFGGHCPYPGPYRYVPMR